MILPAYVLLQLQFMKDDPKGGLRFLISKMTKAWE